jgi:O-antigen/teichoic acid export membrane protein
MSAKAVTKGIISIGGWSAAKMATSALLSPVLARFLGIEGYGRYAYYLAVLLLASQVANMGMMQTMTKRIAERPLDLPWCRAVAWAGALINGAGVLVVGVAVGLLIIGTAPQATAAVPIALVVVGVLLFDQMWFYARGILYGLRQEERAAIPGIVGVVTAGMFGAGAAVGGLGVAGVLIGLLVTDLFVAVVCLRSVVRTLDMVGSEPPDHVASSPTRTMVRFGMSAMVFSVLNMALCSLDLILVRHLAGEAQAGFYAAAVQWSQFVWFIPIAVEGVMLQATARFWAEQRIGEVTSLVSRLARYVVLGTAFLLLLVSVLGDRIILLYFGPQFSEAVVALRLLAPGALWFALARVMWPVIQAGGKAVDLIRVMGAIVLLDVGLCLAFVPVWGAAGAAVATSISFTLVALGYVWMLHRRQVRILEGFPVSRLIGLWLGTGAAVAGAAALVSIPLLSVVVGGLVGMMVYVGGVFWLGLLKVDEVESMVQSLPGALRQVGEPMFRRVEPLLLRLKAVTLN